MSIGNTMLLKTKQTVNPNLLDNWCFVSGGQGTQQFPINQKGQTSYSGSNGTFLDRWYSNSTTLCTISSDGLLITSTDGTNNALFHQFIENPERFLNKTVTVSVLCSNNQFQSQTVTIPSTFEASKNYFSVGFDSGAQYYFRTNANAQLQFRIATKLQNLTTKTVAVKVELGNTQTLAHQENGIWCLSDIPNYSDELWKCQRYYQIFKTSSLRPSDKDDFRPVMRANPSTGTISIDGTTYYYADANLS